LLNFPQVAAPLHTPARFLCALSLGLTASIAPAFAGEGRAGTVRNEGAPVSVFEGMSEQLEPSTLTFRETSFNLPGSHFREDTASYSVEASIAPPFTLVRAVLGGPAPGSYMLNIVPKFVVRRSDGVVSNPVRTPSYMPSAALYYSPWKMLPETSPGGLAGRPHYWYLSFTTMHYSNGAIGPFLNPDGSLNNVDGSFSLWSASAAVHVQNGWPWLPEYKALHVEYLFNKENALDALYPDWVVSLKLRTAGTRLGGGTGLGGRARVLMDLDWRIRRVNGMPEALKPAPFSGALTGVYAPQWAPLRSGTRGGGVSAFVMDFAFFGRLYGGFDYYNMNFDREIYRVDFGLMFGPRGGLAGTGG
jgi:hypothetical protein